MLIFARNSVATAIFAAASIWTAAPANADDPVITIYSAGLDQMLADEKDRGLLRALEMLPSRIAELPIDFNADDFPTPIFQMGVDVFRQPMQLTLTFKEGVDAREEPPFSALLVSQASQSRDWAKMLQSMMNDGPGEGLGQVVDGQPGMMRFDADGIPVFIGHAGAGAESSLVLGLREMNAGVPAPSAHELPAGVAPLVTFDIDGAQLGSLVEGMLELAPPDQRPAIEAQLSFYGLGGDSPMSMRGAWGHSESHMYGIVRQTNFRSQPFAELYDEPLRDADYQLIPADAVAMQLARNDLSKLQDLAGTMISTLAGVPEDRVEQELAEFYAEVQRELGVHIERDLIAHLGTVVGWHMGPAGGTSLCGVLELRDPAAFAGTIRKLSDRMNQMAEGEFNGRVRIVQREIDGVALSTLVFPGLPIPLEISWVIQDSFLFAGLTPGNAIGAASLRGSGRPTLLEAPQFDLAPHRGSAVAVGFMNNRALAGGGYGMASLAMSAVANAMRSPQDLTRDPGLMMPPFHEFTDGIENSLTVYRIDGDDFVTETWTDRSVTVSVASVLGLINTSPALIAGGVATVGLLMPALNNARQAARQAQAMAQLREVGMARAVFEAEKERAPSGFDELIEAGYLEASLLRSPFGPVGDGEGDYWISGSDNTVTDPSRRVVGVDRASIWEGDAVVLFADGHVESMDSWEFRQLLDSEINTGVEVPMPWEK